MQTNPKQMQEISEQQPKDMDVKTQRKGKVLLTGQKEEKKQEEEKVPTLLVGQNANIQKDDIQADLNIDQDDETVRFKKKKKQSKVSKDKSESEGEEKFEEEIQLTEICKNQKPQKNELVDLIKDCRIITKEIQKNFGYIPQEKLYSMATQNQVLHIVEQASEVDFKKPEQIQWFMKEKGFNCKDVFSLQYLAEGGESIIYRGDLLQPLELVVKSVLPRQVNQDSLASILSESHMIKLIKNKEYVVEIFEEIIEVEKDTCQILNYVVVVEQAVQDMSKMVRTWTSLEQDGTRYFEVLTPQKLFYFIFKAACALENLHSQDIYYGDMKEPNLLVFRDYSVKLGDFGISIKMKKKRKNDPDEAIYELKGGTKGYLPPIQYEKVETQEKLTRNELIKNDYISLFQTFCNIEKRCVEYFKEEQKALKEVDLNLSDRDINFILQVGNEEKEAKKYNFIASQELSIWRKEGCIKHFFTNNNYSLDEDSYFVQFLNEIKILDPTKYPLRELISRFKKKLKKDHGFISTLCNELIKDEKYYAIPNALSLWEYQHISQTIKSYFKQEELKEFPFLKPKQSIQLPGELEVGESTKNIQEEEVIAKIQKYIQKRSKHLNKILDIVVLLVSYKSCLLESFSNSLYQRIFGLYFTFQGQPLRHLCQNNDDENLKVYLSSIRLFHADPQKPFLEEEQLQTILNFLLFTYSIQDGNIIDLKFAGTLAFYASMQVRCLAKSIIQRKGRKNILLESKFCRVVYELNSSLGFKDANCSELISKIDEAKNQGINYLIPLLHHKDLKIKDLYLPPTDLNISFGIGSLQATVPLINKQKEKTMIQILDKAQAFRVLTHSTTVKFILQSLKQQENSKLDIRVAEKLFIHLRESWKRVYSELDDKLCKLSYRLYKQLQKSEKQGVKSDLTLLIKVSTFGSSRKRCKYMFELIEEYQRRGMTSEINQVIERLKSVSPLLNSIATCLYLNSQLNLKEIQQLSIEFWDNDKLYSFLRIILEQKYYSLLSTQLGYDYDKDEVGQNRFIFQIYLTFIIPQLDQIYDFEQQKEKFAQAGKSITIKNDKTLTFINFDFKLGIKMSFELKDQVLHGKQTFTNTKQFFQIVEFYTEGQKTNDYNSVILHGINNKKSFKLVSNNKTSKKLIIRRRDSSHDKKNSEFTNQDECFGSYLSCQQIQEGLFRDFKAQQFKNRNLTFSKEDHSNIVHITTTNSSLCWSGIHKFNKLKFKINFYQKAIQSEDNFLKCCQLKSGEVGWIEKLKSDIAILPTLNLKTRNLNKLKSFGKQHLNEENPIFFEEDREGAIFYAKIVSQMIKQNEKENGIAISVMQDPDQRIISSKLNENNQLVIPSCSWSVRRRKQLLQKIQHEENVQETRTLDSSFRLKHLSQFNDLGSMNLSDQGSVTSYQIDSSTSYFDYHQKNFYHLHGADKTNSEDFMFYDNGFLSSSLIRTEEKMWIYQQYHNNGQLMLASIIVDKRTEGRHLSNIQLDKFYPLTPLYKRNGEIHMDGKEQGFQHIRVTVHRDGYCQRVETEKFDSYYHENANLIWLGKKNRLKSSGYGYPFSDQEWYTPNHKYYKKAFLTEEECEDEDNLLCFKYYQEGKLIGTQTNTFFGREGTILTFAKEEMHSTVYLMLKETFQDDMLKRQQVFLPNGNVCSEATYANLAYDGMMMSFGLGSREQLEFSQGLKHGIHLTLDMRGEINNLEIYKQNEEVKNYKDLIKERQGLEPALKEDLNEI